MEAPLTITDLTDRERELLMLFAKGQLPEREEQEWGEMINRRPQLEAMAGKVRELEPRRAAEGRNATPIPRAEAERLDTVRARRISERSPRRGANRKKSQSPLTVYVLIGLLVTAAMVSGLLLWEKESKLPPARPGPEVKKMAITPAPQGDEQALPKSPVPETPKIAIAPDKVKVDPASPPSPRVVWQAPAAETTLLRPVIIWTGAPGQTYNVNIADVAGKVFAEARSVQSPWLLEADLPAGGTYLVSLQAIGGQEVSMHDFRVVSDARPLAANLKQQMEKLAEAGRNEDALMLLMRVPEEALAKSMRLAWQERLMEP